MKATPRRPYRPAGQENQKQAKIDRMAGPPGQSSDTLSAPADNHAALAANRYFPRYWVNRLRPMLMIAPSTDLSTLLNGSVRGRQLAFGLKQKDQPAETEVPYPHYHRNANRY
jgi:hypothetical protein